MVQMYFSFNRHIFHFFSTNGQSRSDLWIVHVQISVSFPSSPLIGQGVYYTNTNGFKAFAVQPSPSYNLQTSLKMQPEAVKSSPWRSPRTFTEFNLFSLLTTKWESESKWAQAGEKGAHKPQVIQHPKIPLHTSPGNQGWFTTGA